MSTRINTEKRDGRSADVKQVRTEQYSQLLQQYEGAVISTGSNVNTTPGKFIEDL